MAVRTFAPAPLILAVLLVATTFCAGPAAAQPASEDGLTADSIIVRIDVHDNGTAVWSVHYQYQLETSNETRGFDQFKRSLAEDRDAYLDDVRSDVGRTVRAADNRTDRPMRLGNVSVSVRQQTIANDVSIVRHRFVWHGFAATNDSSLRVGDAIRGFTLGPAAKLVVTWPEEYDPASLDPSPSSTDGDEATWAKADFTVDEPRFVFTRATGSPRVPLFEAAVVAVMVGIGAIAIVRRSDRGPIGDVAGSEPLDDETRDDDVERSTESERPDDAAEESEIDESPPEPLSNEERVLWVLEKHDGRVKQQTLAEECDWSDSKTSRVVRRLHEDDRIDLFRLGRENVVSLPEVDHDDV